MRNRNFIVLVLCLWCVSATSSFLPHRRKTFRAAGPAVAPAYVNSSTGGTGGGSPSVFGALTISAGANLILLCSVGQGNAGGTPKSITSVIWSGGGTPQNLTAIPSATANDGVFCSIAGYYLVAPTPQVGGTVTVTFGASADICGIFASVYSGANQGPVLGTPQTNTTTSSATLTTTVAPGTGRRSWGAVACDANANLAISGTSSPTQRLGPSVVSSDVSFAIGDTTGSGTFIWSWTGGDNGGAMFTVIFDGI